MPDMSDKKPLLTPNIPEPTEEDLSWAAKIQEKGFKRHKSNLKIIVNNNQVWRMNFLCNDYKGKPINLSHKYFFTQSYSNEHLIGMAITHGYEDMALIIGKTSPDWARCRSKKGSWETAINADSPKMIYALLHCEADIWDCFNTALAETTHDTYSVFIKGGFIEPSYKSLLRAVSSNNIKAITLLVNNEDSSLNVDISENNYAAIKKAQSNGFFNTAKYLKDMSNAKNKQNSSAPLVPKEKITGRETYQKLSDTELLRTNISEDGNMKLTTIFNFEMRDITRIHYVTDQIPVQTCKNFEDLEDMQSLRPMFDKLIALDGHPPDNIFKQVSKVKIQQQP